MSSFRSFFPADPGFVMVEHDLSQAEARIVAARANDFEMLKAFKDNIDVHSLRASMMFDKDYEWIVANKKNDKTEAPTLRYDAKRCVHAYNYGMREVLLQNLYARSGVKKTRTECKELLAKVEATSPATTAWHMWVENHLLSNAFTMNTVFGRQATFVARFRKKGRLHDAVLRKAYAFEPQSTVGDALNFGLYRTWCAIQAGEFDPWPVHLLTQVHDSISYETPKEALEYVVPKIAKLLLIPLDIRNTRIVIPVETKIGPNWGELEEVKEFAAADKDLEIKEVKIGDDYFDGTAWRFAK